jgi:cellobiose phosphorylase
LRILSHDLSELKAIGDAPLRAELFSAGQMEQHGYVLAKQHVLASGSGGDRLLSRLAENEAILLNAVRILTATVKANNRVSPAGEWLLDNFYLVEEQIRIAKSHLPKGYSKQLPRLLGGVNANFPRVYDIALETISHGDGRLDSESLSRLISAYQTVTHLTLGELWAIPIMLRMALIENLRRVAARIATDSEERDFAYSWAQQMIEVAEKDPKNLVVTLADMARSSPPRASAFVSELTRLLRGQGPALALPLSWIEQWLSEVGLTTEQLVQSESQLQAQDQVSISNTITSLRALASFNWRDFVEEHSSVEQILRDDPSAVYKRMDFATRDHYRHVVEKLAKNTHLTESEVARQAVRLAAVAAREEGQEERKHVGYFLVDKGFSQLEKTVEVELSLVDHIRRAAKSYPQIVYFGTIGAITVCLTTLSISRYYAKNDLPIWAWIVISVLLLFVVSQFAVTIINWLSTLFAKAYPLPKMDYSKGIPEDDSTMVVVPTMLTSVSAVEDMVEALEVRYLANQDDNVYFALLTDFTDSPVETQSDDSLLVSSVRKRIEELNLKYGDGKDVFYLFHRPRLWNANDNIWMGHERKRGKLGDLNCLLSGGKNNFSAIEGDIANLAKVRFIITLDADTNLPLEAARQFVGAIAHPLNRARYDESKQRVVEGYGILQPRVDVSLSPLTHRSPYARLYGSGVGIDPYTRTVSDVYQDLFHEGSFIGKGIYEIAAFEKSLRDRFCENQILSHDLLEGCYVRSGLLSDAQLYEEYPSSYSFDVARRSRWIRGDWQLLPWLLPFASNADQRRGAAPLSLLSKWKIFDNLRRSLVSACQLVMFVLAFTVLLPHWFWVTFLMALMFVPPILTSLTELVRKPEELEIGQHISTVLASFRVHLAQILYGLACLPYEATYSLSAIGRTLWRMYFSHKKLLEWRTAGETRSDDSLTSFLRSMWTTELLAISLVVYLASTPSKSALPLAMPILLLWIASPLIAAHFSKSVAPMVSPLTQEHELFLRQIARKTWQYFKALVGPEDNYLPPDNYQEEPVERIAHRTSPTNIGMALLANLAAYDFGYIHVTELIERTHSTLSTLHRLERYKGHFYNWYDTISLAPLPPRYVSTVDSGNLAGHLLTLRPGLIGLVDDPVITTRLFEAIYDTCSLLKQALGPASEQINGFETLLEGARRSDTKSLLAITTHLVGLEASAAKLLANLVLMCDPRGGKDPSEEVEIYTSALHQQCQAALLEVNMLSPWVQTDGFAKIVTVDPTIDQVPSIRQLASYDDVALQFNWQALADLSDEEKENIEASLLTMTQASERAQELVVTIENLASSLGKLAQMPFDFLYDNSRHLLSIGYNVEDHRLDQSFYDLLASEARLGNFVAIAQGQLPKESWFSLGRLLTRAAGEAVLFSWSGSMFEYLMPLLVMPNYEDTLLDQTYRICVARQIEYGKQRGVPWGISESGYNNVDVNLNYQYRAFGVPGLGLKRGLVEDLVIAPYACVMALMVAPEEAVTNLLKMHASGFSGKYGFYEAVDYTASRVPRGHTNVVVRSFMVHHEGMSLLSLAYRLLGMPMQKRFMADPSFQATDLLLQERVPKVKPVQSITSEIADLRTTPDSAESSVRVLTSPDSPAPELQLLSNGRYHVMVSNSGGGYSRWKDMAVTRWREDATTDNWGSFCYIRDRESGDFFSTTYQPTLEVPDSFEAIFSESKVEFRRRDGHLDTHTEIVVSPEDDIEVRRIQLTNRSRNRRVIDVTSYGEVVITSASADTAHTAFSNLFVQTEIDQERQTILCHRRPRAADEQTPWMFHLMAVHGAEVAETSYETDRARFIGRGNTVADPLAMKRLSPLSGTQGSVLDPIVSVRHRITIEAEDTVTINIVSGMHETKEGAQALADKYRDRGLAARVFDLAWTHSQVVLRQLNATESDAQLYNKLAGSVVYANRALRADSDVLLKNTRGQSGLWGYSVSGDVPVVLLQIKEQANSSLVRQLVQAHAYWRLKGLVCDLVIWNEDQAGYRQILQEEILGIIASGIESHMGEGTGGIFVRPAEQISAEDRILFKAVARVIISDSNGTLAEQIAGHGLRDKRPGRLVATRIFKPEIAKASPSLRSDLILVNGLGGFTSDGREYVIATDSNQLTPAPWSNVLANRFFGTVVSESGSVYTWAENAHEFRLTPWNNDPITDASGEAFYLRDEETANFWSPTPLPARGATPYTSRHGFGYSAFEHTESGIESEMLIFVAADENIKFSVLKVKNRSGRPRKLSATGYIEWILGDLKSKTGMHVATELDVKTGALLARNAYNTEFAGRVAFFDVSDTTRTITCDRTEFIGRNGSLSSPAAMKRIRLSGKFGAGLDPCAAIQVPFELQDGEEREIVFRLGVGNDINHARGIINRFRGLAAKRDAYENVCHYWKHTLGAVNIETPDASVNMLVNGWLMYQTIGCRIWGRTGYYQSGGAFGFRDQLQDCMALVHCEPLILRDQLLKNAAHQFVEGDVQHWWHPPTGRGVRTHCSDDYLWLPLAAYRYVSTTGDTGILDETVSFLSGRLVNEDEESYYDLPTQSDEKGSLYEHCVRAIKFGLRFGVHGLPLIGAGDWNDGMNLVGEKGKGESVWLAFFLFEVLNSFAKLAEKRGDIAMVELCHEQAKLLKENISSSAWDGEWYRRAYFDDGTPLGTAGGVECQIDSIAQSWSVLSGGGEPSRCSQAMGSLNKRLVRREHALIQLLDPPFDKSELNPGYIKGYVPGVRENGGQYTHSAIWAAMAFAKLGDNRLAWELASMINPVNHANSPEKVALYKVEPYVVSADVYAVSPHVGRGGWSWYTGSAGWFYRLLTESLLGIRLEIDKLYFAPCLPSDWQSFKLHYRFRETVFHITCKQVDSADKAISITLDGNDCGEYLQLLEDRKDHFVDVIVRRSAGH